MLFKDQKWPIRTRRKPDPIDSNTSSKRAEPYKSSHIKISHETTVTSVA
jgi:hypothetical protein